MMMKKLLFLVMMLSFSVALWAQRSIEGMVTDAKTGETLIGVTVQLKGTSIGTTTDINGRYLLTSEQLNATASGLSQSGVDLIPSKILV